MNRHVGWGEVPVTSISEFWFTPFPTKECGWARTRVSLTAQRRSIDQSLARDGAKLTPKPYGSIAPDKQASTPGLAGG